jgi:limonene-1,2-epoxide hydrolase
LFRTTDAEAVVRRTLHLLETRHADQAVELLDPEVEWRNTGLPTVRGARRVGGMLRDMERRGIRFSAEFHHVASDGDAVLTDRTDLLRYGRWSASFWVRGTFVVRDGRIVLWDDAFGWGNFLGACLIGLGRALLPR